MTSGSSSSVRRRSEAVFTVRSRAFVAALAASLGCTACYSQTRYDEMVAAASVDLGYEMDLLYSCAYVVGESIDDIARTDENLRLVVTEWSVDDVSRHRTALRVVFDQDYGPGVSVALAREMWRGDPELVDPLALSLPEPDGMTAGWVPAPRLGGDADYEADHASRVAECWSSQRE